MLKPETLAIHAWQKLKSNTGDVISPINLSTTFYRDADGNYPGGYMYSRVNNPNRESLEEVMSKLEYAEASSAFSSGNTAGMAIFQALEPGSHIIAPDDMYWGFKKQLLTVFKDILSFDFIDLTQTEEIEHYIKANTKLIWVETPSNPLLKICDIQEISAIAQKNNLRLVCDSTFASPILQNPILLGADIVMHSTTKYIGGHSDVLGGCLCTAKKDEFWNKIKNIQEVGGAVPSPFDCFLLLRSLKTLAYRMKGHELNANQLAEYLNQHTKIERVIYPGIDSHPQHELAKRQMKGFGGMISIQVKAGEKAANYICNHLQLFSQATSLGGVESLIEHRASVEGPDSKTPKNLIRISVGLEHIDDLIADFDRVLKEV